MSEVYPSSWHTYFADQTSASAATVLPPLLELFGAKSLLELGCGYAHWTQAAVKAGIEDYIAADGPWNDVSQLLVDRKMYVEHDLATALDLGRRFDMAVCLEVGEHVAADKADNVTDSLTRASDVVVFGAAIPLQGGYGHINEQWPSWWRAKFEALGYAAFDLVRPRHWQDQSIHYYYRQNIFVYVNRANEKQMAAATAEQQRLFATPGFLVDAVHPEKYDEMVSYRAIALKRLIQQVPKVLAHRLKTKLQMGSK